MKTIARIFAVLFMLDAIVLSVSATDTVGYATSIILGIFSVFVFVIAPAIEKEENESPHRNKLK